VTSPRPLRLWRTARTDAPMANGCADGQERCPPLPPELAAMLAARRRELGWSYREAGRRTGVAFGYIHDLEHRRRGPSVVVARELAIGYGLSVREADWLESASVIGHGRDWRPVLPWPFGPLPPLPPPA